MQPEAWETLGGDCFKALGGGAAAKNGQEKEKAKMFTEKKKKVSGKYDGEIERIQGMALRSCLGRGRSPHTAGEKAGEAAPQMHPSPTNTLSLFADCITGSLSSDGAHIPLLSLKAAGLSDLRCTPLPGPFSRSPRGSGWVWASSSSFV